MSGFTEERRLAEQSMDNRWSTDLSKLEARQWPAAASRIREARLRAAISEAEVARLMGLTVSAYCDLEGYDSEAFDSVSLSQLGVLGRILNVQPRMLLLGFEAEGLKQSILPGEITGLLAKRMLANGQSVDQLGAAIGWDIRELFDDPNTLWSFDVEGLYEICKAIGVDWVEALPELDPAGQPPADINERLEQPVRQIIGHLVAGEFAALEVLTKGQRLNAREMEKAIRDYGRKLVMPPDDAFRLMDVVEVRNGRQRQWSVWMPLWTQEEGRCDLTIEVELIADGENFSIGLDNIRVP